MNAHQQGFLDFCKFNLGLSQNTVDSYGWDMKAFFDWLSPRRIAPEAVKVGDIDDFLAFVRKKGRSIKTVNRKIYCLKSFYRWLLRREVITQSPMDHFRNIRQPRPLPRFLTIDEQNRLLREAAKKNGEPFWIHERNRLLFLFLLETGLRVSELCSVRLKDINFAEGLFRVTGKGSKERVVVMSDRLKAAVQRYLSTLQRIKFTPEGMREFPGFAARGLTVRSVGEKVGVTRAAARIAIQGHCDSTFRKIKTFWDKEGSKLPQEYLFFTRKAGPMITRHVFRIVREVGQRAKIEGLYPHLLRHTFASNLRRKRADILLIKEALGHSSVQTTEIYAHIGDQEYKEQMREYLQ